MSRLPPEDEVTRPWWDGTRRRQLLLQRCRRCDRYQHPPRPLCTGCGATTLDFVPSEGTGRLLSFTVVHRPADPSRPAGYVVGVVALDEGPVLLTNIVDDGLRPPPGTALACDQEVHLRFVVLEDGRALPVWSPGGDPVTLEPSVRTPPVDAPGPHDGVEWAPGAADPRA